MACVHLNWVFLIVFFFLLFCFLKIPKSTTWSAFDILKKTSQNWVSHMCIVDVISLLTRLSCLNVYVCVCERVTKMCMTKISSKWTKTLVRWTDSLLIYALLKKSENILTCFFSGSLRQGYTWINDFAISKNSFLFDFLLNQMHYF